MNTWWSLPLQTLKGVGPGNATRLASLNLFTLGDLLSYYPRAYLDFSRLKQINELQIGEEETCRAVMVRMEGKTAGASRGGGNHPVRILLQDKTGYLELVSFSPYMKHQFRPGRDIIVSGTIERQPHTRYLRITNPEIEEAALSQHLRTGRIVPVYGRREGIGKKLIGSLVHQALSLYASKIVDFIPRNILCENNLMMRADAFRNIHFPENKDCLHKARQRLLFEELFLLQCGLIYLRKRNKTVCCGIKHAPDGHLVTKAVASLPFVLTADQQRVLGDIKADMEDVAPMRRLVQGDVGSGKTAVAAIALVKTVENGYQGALMAPTEILAGQHYHTLSTLLASLGVRIALLSARLARKERVEVLQNIRSGQVDLIIGTHALIQEGVEFSNLGLAVTDEQHRFGVEQRAMLQAKGHNVDVLVMTATPIPRTLALTVYGDLDVSVIRHLPPGRKPVRTLLYGPEKRSEIYARVVRRARMNQQSYVVCPLVEEAETLNLRSAVELYEELTKDWLRDIPCGLVHGRMTAEEKDSVMQAYHEGAIKVLVATTVIEVGVNVPNATLMIIENAERFGLAQLHQLRGRIGRGTEESFCVLLSGSRQQNAQDRLKLMTQYSDGMVLAEKDLQIRGPGQFFGHRQHGLPDLKLADIVNDVEVLFVARHAALDTIKELELPSPLRQALSYQFGSHFSDLFQS